MGLFDDLQNKASELLGGTDIGGSVEDLTTGAQDGVQDATSGVQDAASSAQDLGAGVQEQITQYAEEHGISWEAARDHIVGGGN